MLFSNVADLRRLFQIWLELMHQMYFLLVFHPLSVAVTLPSPNRASYLYHLLTFSFTAPVLLLSHITSDSHLHPLHPAWNILHLCNLLCCRSSAVWKHSVGGWSSTIFKAKFENSEFSCFYMILFQLFKWNLTYCIPSIKKNCQKVISIIFN